MGKVWSKQVMAANIRRYLAATGETQKELAEIVGVSAPTVNDWCNAKKYPRIDKIEIMAEHWGIAKSELIEDKLTAERAAQNDILADIIARLRTDDDYLKLVEIEYPLNVQKVRKVTSIVNAFLEQLDD